MSAKQVRLDYTNHRGERSERRIEPIQIFWGSNEWHQEPQWLLEAWDFEKRAHRVFAVKDIHAWKPSGGEA